MKTAVIGASGYAGGELLRLLAIHPHFQVTVVSAHSNAGEQVTTVHPQLQSYAGRSFVSTDSIDFSSLDLVFLALPHGESAALTEKIPAHVKIVDLGADFRLENAAQWDKYYGGKHAGAWVYGLPELSVEQREAIKKQSKVANPGCYATSISLGITPALHLIDSTASDPLQNWRTIRSELAAYDEGLARKPELIVLSKSDSAPDDYLTDLSDALRAEGVEHIMSMSSVSGTGVKDVLRALFNTITAEAEAERRATMPETEWQPHDDA